MSKRGRRDRIFISYRRTDSAGHAGRLKDDLTRLLGNRVFMDVSDIAPGAEFERVLYDELQSCGAVLAVIGERWRETFDSPREGKDYVLLELAQALAHDDVQVVPVLMQGASLPSTTDLPVGLQAIGSRQATVIRDDRWNDDIANLARSLRVALRLPRRAVRWIAGGVVVLIMLALGIVLNAPLPPAAFSRSQAHEITVAATKTAVAACHPAAGMRGACPLVFRFAPDGSPINVYFDSGSCILKAPPFGECLLKRLVAVRIPPFDNVAEAEVGLMVHIEAGGSVKAIPDQ